VLSPGNKLCKFADDTYFIIPASNVDSRSAEFNNIETWARKNNLTLKRSKSKEIVFIDRKRKREAAPPREMAGIFRVTSLKIFGVTVTNKLSASDHVHDIIKNCAVTVCTVGLTCSWYVRLWPPSYLLINHQRQATVRIQYLVGLHQCKR